MAGNNESYYQLASASEMALKKRKQRISVMAQ